jgi:hypothetical protein
MKSALAILLTLLIGCGGAIPVSIGAKTSQAFRVEEEKLPPRPDEKPIPPDKDWVVPLAKDTPSPKNGVLISPEKAVRAAKYKARYNELRTLAELDKRVWKNRAVIHDEQLGQANRTIKQLTPGWWDKNKGTLGFTTGMVLGAVMTIFVVYGVDQVQEK